MSERNYKAAILDLDGVVTRTATLHAQAWKEMFDDFLERWSDRGGEDHTPFDFERDYLRYVDGKPRFDGVRSFLASRGIELPEGEPDDPVEADTVQGLGNRKNDIFLELLEREEVQLFEDAVGQVRRWQNQGLRTALITSSRNGRRILKAAGLEELFEVVVDGNDSERLGIRGKPAPDIFLHAARELGVAPHEAIVVEDAISGVEAGRAGDFGLVVGVARNGGEALQQAGADVVVSDLREIEEKSRLAGDDGEVRPEETEGEPGNRSRSTPPSPGATRHRFDKLRAGPLPPRAGGEGRGEGASLPARASGPSANRANALEHLDRLAGRLDDKQLALFFDYDGTLTPIVRRPEDATLSDEMRSLLRELAGRVTVAVVSGRDLADVRRMVELDELYYAGSHGFDVAGPGGMRMQQEAARKHLPDLDEAERKLEDRLEEVEGAWVERKRFAIAVHFREADEADEPRVGQAVDEVRAAHPRLRRKGGKKIFELQPDVPWDKGYAVRWLLEQLELDGPEVLPVYVGDDLTDEDAFRALAGRGLGIRVGSPDEPTDAEFYLRDTRELEAFIRELLQRLPRQSDDHA
jgi:trehalose-phosphatase